MAGTEAGPTSPDGAPGPTPAAGVWANPGLHLSTPSPPPRPTPTTPKTPTHTRPQLPLPADQRAPAHALAGVRSLGGSARGPRPAFGGGRGVSTRISRGRAGGRRPGPPLRKAAPFLSPRGAGRGRLQPARPGGPGARGRAGAGAPAGS